MIFRSEEFLVIKICWSTANEYFIVSESHTACILSKHLSQSVKVFFWHWQQIVEVRFCSLPAWLVYVFSASICGRNSFNIILVPMSYISLLDLHKLQASSARSGLFQIIHMLRIRGRILIFEKCPRKSFFVLIVFLHWQQIVELLRFRHLPELLV